MSLREHFAEYKEIVKNHSNIKQNHKKFYIAWVDSFKKFVGRKIPTFCKFNNTGNHLLFPRAPG